MDHNYQQSQQWTESLKIKCFKNLDNENCYPTLISIKENPFKKYSANY